MLILGEASDKTVKLGPMYTFYPPILLVCLPPNLKTAPKGVENPMFFHPQSVERPPPIGFLIRGMRAA